MKFQSYFDAEMRLLQQANCENPDPDPSADRILEGVAHLTARIQQRLDHDFPEIPARIIHQHWPHMLQPYASRTILQFSHPTQITLPKNTVVSSPPVGEEKGVCKFSTLEALVIYPIELINVELQNTTLKFYVENKKPSSPIKNIKLYLNTDIHTALELYYAFGTGCVTSEHHWLDYFGFREKYLFLELDNIEITPNKFFEISLQARHPLPAGIEIKKEFFKVNCVPAINSYKTHSEPIIYKAHRWDYEVVPDKNYPKSVMLQNIQALMTLDSKKIDYQWDYLRSRLLILNENIENNAVLTCEIMATNGYYPQQYIKERVMNNVTRPTPYLYPLDNKDCLGKLMGLLNLNINKLFLKDILILFNWTDKRCFQQQIDGILSCENKPINKIIRGVFYQGLEFTVKIKEEGFRGVAEIYLFGCVLQAFLTSSTPINCLIKTVIELCPSSKTLVF